MANAGAHNTPNPSGKAYAVTPNDSTDLTTVTRGIYVGTGGNLRVNMADNGNTVTFPNVQDGTLLPIRVSRVLSTSTTASDIVALE